MRLPHPTLGLLIVLVGVFVSGAAAQDPEAYEGGISIGPLKLVADVGPGQTWEGSVRMLGRPGKRSTFDIAVFDLAQSLVGHKGSVDVGQGSRSAADWIDVVSEVTVDGDARHDLAVTIRVPAGAYGAYSAFLAIQPKRDEPTVQMAATVIPTINVEVLVRVRSSGPLELGVEDIELRSESGPSQALVVGVHNTGVWVSDIRGDILMYPESGGFPERVELPCRSDGRPHELYPGQKIRLRCEPAAVLRSGTYRVLARLDLGEGRESRSEFSLAVLPDSGDDAQSAAADRKTELGTDLWIEQPVQEIDVPPGAVRSVPVRISNSGDSPFSLRVSVEDARLETDGRWTYSGSPIPHPGLTCEVTPDSIIIGPKASSAVRVTLRLERDASLSSTVVKGIRFAGRQEGRAADGWETEHDVSALIIIEPTTRGVASLGIADLELVRSSPGTNPGSAVLTVVNHGEGVGEIRGRMTLRSDPGELVAELAIGSKGWERVMPERQRRFRMPLPIVDEGVFTVGVELEQREVPDQLLRAEASFTSTEAVPEGFLDE